MAGELIISKVDRKAARSLGLKRYFTGLPCKRGHVTERFVVDCGCVDCAKEKWKKYYTPEKERARHIARRDANPGKFLAYSREYNEKNRDKRNAGARRRHKDNPAKAREKVVRMRAADPDKLRSYGRKHYAKHREARKEYSRRWREKNPEAVKKQYSIWFQNNPLKSKAKSHRRRARIVGVGGNYTQYEIENIYKLQSGKCAYCRVNLADKYQIDHILPLCEGGKNIAANIQLLCNRAGGGCNQRKGGKHPIDFARSLGLLI